MRLTIRKRDADNNAILAIMDVDGTNPTEKEIFTDLLIERIRGGDTVLVSAEKPRDREELDRGSL